MLKDWGCLSSFFDRLDKPYSSEVCPEGKISWENGHQLVYRFNYSSNQPTIIASALRWGWYMSHLQKVFHVSCPSCDLLSAFWAESVVQMGPGPIWKYKYLSEVPKYLSIFSGVFVWVLLTCRFRRCDGHCCIGRSWWGAPSHQSKPATQTFSNLGNKYI